jgi:hypothetical protein
LSFLDAFQDGVVLRYPFLWSHERGRGEEAGRKPGRSNVLVKRFAFGGEEWVAILPITSKPPRPGAPAYALGDLDIRRAGLPGPAPLWIVLDEANLEPLGRSFNLEPGSVVGRLPPATYRAVLDRFRAGWEHAKKTSRA